MDVQEQTREPLIGELARLKSRAAELEAQLARHGQVAAGWWQTYNNLPVLVATAGCDGYYERVNAAFERILGWSEQESLSRPFLEFIHPDDRAAVTIAFEGLKSARPVTNFVDRHLCKDGSHRWFNWMVVPLPDRAAVFGVGQDITDWKHAEAALRASESRYRRLYESLMDAFVMVSMDGRIQEFNEAYRQMVGYEAEELRTLTYMDITPEQWHVFQAKIIREQVLKRGYSDLYEKEYRRKDGKIISVELRTYLVTEENGNPAAMWAIIRDTTARRQAALALQESEERFRKVFDEGPLGITLVGLDGGVRRCNQRFCDMLGYSEAEIISLGVPGITHPVDLETDYHLWARLFRGDIPSYRIEKRYLREDGQVIWGQWTASMMHGADGKPSMVIGTFEDITARKIAEESLAESQRLSRMLMDASPESIFLLDTAGMVLSANETTARRLGTSVSDIVGRAIYDWLPADVAANRKRYVEEVVRTGQAVRFEDRRLGRCLENAIYPILDEQGNVTRIAVLGIDLTERKRNEEALRDSEARFRSLFEDSSVGTVVVSPEGKFLQVNKAFCEFLGYSREELLGMTVESITYPDDLHVTGAAMRQAMESGPRIQRLEKRYLHKSGRTLWGEVSSSLVRDAQGLPCYFITQVLDITKRKQAEEALKKAHEELEQNVKDRTAELAIFRRFVEASGRGFGMTDLEGRITYANATLCRLFGETNPDDVVAKDVCSYYPEECRQRREDEVVPALLRDGSWQGELEILSRSGTLTPIFQNTFLIRDDQGEPFRFGIAVTDISELKRTEAALRKSEERFELAVRSAGVGIWDWNIRTGQVYYSPAWKKLFGYEESEIGDRFDDWARLLHPAEREWIIKFQEDFLAGVLPTVTAEYRLRHKNGSYRWIKAYGLVVRDEQGKACRLVGSHADITDHKQVEEALRQNEAKYRALVESCPDSVVMADLQGRITFASQRAAEQHGLLHPQELVGRSATELVIEADRGKFKANIGRLLQEGVHRNINYSGLRNDGTTFDAEISSAVIRDAAGNPEALMAVYRDVTQRNQAEALLRTKDAELLAAAGIQAHLLPQEPPQVPGFDIAGRCYPAEVAAGDHFDYLWLPDGTLLVVMGDVSGHGIGPAIMAADFCARLRTLSENSCDLPEMARRVNTGLYRETAGEKFVTAILGRLDPKTRTLTYVNAGHPPGMVLNSAGEIKARLVCGGLSLAIEEETPYVADKPLQLLDGDLVFFYTDGLVEVGSPGEPLFGIERALRVVQANRDRSAAEIIKALYAAAHQFGGAEKPHDDITMVVVKVLASDGNPGNASASNA